MFYNANSRQVIKVTFGHYECTGCNAISGSNYLVSVQEVLESKKKLRIKSLLKLYSASKGVITIRDYIGNFNDVRHQHCDDSFCEKKSHIL